MERGLSNNFGQTNVYYRNLTPKQAALPKLARGQEGSECDSPKVPNHNLTSSLSPPDPVKATTRILRLWLRRRRAGREETAEEGREEGVQSREDRPIPVQRTSPRHVPIQFCSQEDGIREGGPTGHSQGKAGS